MATQAAASDAVTTGEHKRVMITAVRHAVFALPLITNRPRQLIFIQLHH
jgi:hypothetical protein